MTVRCPHCGLLVDPPIEEGDLRCQRCDKSLDIRGSDRPPPSLPPRPPEPVGPPRHDPEVTEGPPSDGPALEGNGEGQPSGLDGYRYQDLSRFRGYPQETTGDVLGEIWVGFRKYIHAIVLIGIGSLALVALVDVAILVWGYFPVHEAALRGEASTVLFFIGLYPVGEVSWTGAGAFAAAGFLLASTWGLLWANRSGKVPGLGGVGTRVLASFTAMGGMTALAGAAYLVATGHMFEGMAAPNVIPTPLGVISLKFHLLAHWHGILVGAILMSFAAMAIRDGPSLVRTLRRSFRRMELPTVRTDNTWFMIFRMYLMILAFYIIYNVILNLFSVQPTVPAFVEEPLWNRLHMFAAASVWEEILSRVLMLGLPLWIYHGLSGRRDVPTWRYAAGGGFRIENAAFALIFAQGLIFALAHVSGWDFWKVLPTTISGMAFGYLFLRKGLWAAIVLHFVFDYLGLTVDAIAVWGADLELLVLLLTLFWAACGLVLLVHYILILTREGPGVLRRALHDPVEGGLEPG